MTRIRFEGFGLKPSQLAKSTPRNDGDFSRDRRNGKQNQGAMSGKVEAGFPSDIAKNQRI
jgi:hypothetical protein